MDIGLPQVVHLPLSSRRVHRNRDVDRSAWRAPLERQCPRHLRSSGSLRNLALGIGIKIRPHRFGGEGVLIGVQSATLNAQVTFVYIAVAISALAGGGGP